MRRWKRLQEGSPHFEFEKPNEAIYGLTGSGTIFSNSTGEILSLHCIVKLALLIGYYPRQTSPTFPLHQCGMQPTVACIPPEVSSLRTF